MHISVSKINMYLRCPAQYYFRYIENIVLPPKAALTKGKVVHAGNEYNYRQKIETKKDLPLREVQDYTAAQFDALAKETDWESEDKGKALDETISLSTLYHTNIAPTVQPVAVEEKIEVEIPGVEIPLLGYIDLIDDQGNIRDTKTTARTPSEDSITNSIQLTAYSLAYRSLRGQEENEVILDYLVSTKTPKVVSLKAKRTQKDIERFKFIAKMVMNGIQNQMFYPNPTGQLCSEKSCGYWHLCQKTF